MDRMKGSSENVSSYSQNLEKEIEDLREEIKKLNDIINTNKNDLISNERRKNQAEIEILDMKKQI